MAQIWIQLRTVKKKRRSEPEIWDFDYHLMFKCDTSKNWTMNLIGTEWNSDNRIRNHDLKPRMAAEIFKPDRTSVELHIEIKNGTERSDWNIYILFGILISSEMKTKTRTKIQLKPFLYFYFFGMPIKHQKLKRTQRTLDLFEFFSPNFSKFLLFSVRKN